MGQSTGLYLLCLFLCILVGFYLLIKGGDWLSDHSANVAVKLGVPPVAVGLTIVSIATSSPELFTSLSAIRSNSTGLILGNIVGSNIANIGLILGIVLLLGNVPTKGAVSFNQRICLLVVTCTFCSFLFFSPKQEIGFLAGFLFLTFIALYLIVLPLHALRKKESSTDQPIGESSPVLQASIRTSMFMLAVSTLALWIGADALVYGSKSMAQLAGVPEELIGFTLLAVGTSLPELAASISLVRKKQTSMLLGNIVGSNLFNISLIGGLVGIIRPVGSSSPHPWVDYVFLLLTTLILINWLRGKTLQKTDGIWLLVLYVVASTCTWVLNS